MNVRSFAWHDLITLYRHRQEIQALDSSLLLTRGNPVGLAAMLTNLDPAHGSFTGVSLPKEGPPAIGQMLYRLGDRSAHLSFILPGPQPLAPALIPLFELLAAQAGEWGAFNLLAELSEHDPVFEALRRSGFGVYTWQRIWQLPDSVPAQVHNGSGNSHSGWQPAASIDGPAVRSLYSNLVPPLVQSVDAWHIGRVSGLVYRQEGEILGYVAHLSGPRGVVLNPLIHPSLENIPQVMRALLRRLPPLLGRPVYMAVRAYQSWLDIALEDLPAQVGPRQALLVKHLTLRQRVTVNNHALVPGMENVQPKPTATVVRAATDLIPMVGVETIFPGGGSASSIVSGQPGNQGVGEGSAFFGL